MSSSALESSTAAAAAHQGQLGAAPDALLVTVPRKIKPGSRRYVPVGLLQVRSGLYEFAYFTSAVVDPTFRPLAGFSEVRRRYTSRQLFPLFAERVMSSSRPDRVDYLDSLDLGPDSEPWEVLGRSGGRRISDDIELTPVPHISTLGLATCTFLVHGVAYRGPEASAVIASLRPGDPLRLTWEEQNPVNPQAVLVTGDDEIQLGYVPDPLVRYIHEVMKDPGHHLQVRRAHGETVPPHQRLLVRLVGTVDPNYRPFPDPDFAWAA